MMQFLHFSKPQPSVPVTRGDRILELLALFLFVIIVVTTILFYQSAPERIPIHFNLEGNADGWGGRGYYIATSIVGALVMGLCNMAAYYPKMVNLPIRLNPKRLAVQHMWMGRMMRTLSLVSGLLILVILCTMAMPQLGLSVPWFKVIMPLLILAILLVVCVYTVIIWKVGR